MKWKEGHYHHSCCCSAHKSLLGVIGLVAAAILFFMNGYLSDHGDLQGVVVPGLTEGTTTPNAKPTLLWSGSSTSATDTTLTVNPTLTYPSGLVPTARRLKNVVLTKQTTSPEAARAFREFVNQQDLECHESVRLGTKGDGGWDMCTVHPYRPSPPCLVYSFGINYDFSFDDDMGHLFGCQVRSFDPSMRRSRSHQRSEHVHFYQLGLGSANHRTPTTQWQIRTLGTIMTLLGDENKVIDYLKIDIDYGEWDVFPVLLSERVLSRVKQLALEVHTSEVVGVRMRTTSAEYFKFWTYLRHIEQELGFRKWYRHLNPQGVFRDRYTHEAMSCCYELVYVNVNFLAGHPHLPTLNITGTLPPRITKSPPVATPRTPKVVTVPKIKARNFNLPEGFSWLNNTEEIIVDYVMDAELAEANFIKHVKRKSIWCPHHVRVGSIHDGGWDLCIASPYQLQVPCLVYSFGINNDWSFDDGISDRFGCKVHSFDPSMHQSDHERGERISFHNMGLSGTATQTAKGCKLRTFSQITKELHQMQLPTIDVLKIDIDSMEWSALMTMFTDGSLSGVHQLVLEVHTKEVDQQSTSNSVDFVYYWRVLQNLENLGFAKWHVHQNELGRYVSTRSRTTRSCCFELYYVNLSIEKR